MVDQDLELRRAVADLRVLHEHDPAAVPSVAEPLFVGQSLPYTLAVDVCHDVDHDARICERGGHHVPAETPIDEELKQRAGGQRG